MSRPQIITEQVPLAPFTTFKIGGVARYFCAAKHVDELIAAYQWARSENLPIFVLGEGSNILVSDDGFPGLVLRNEEVSFELEGTTVACGAGVHLGYLVERCAEQGLRGAQYLVGIPGTVGGAIRGNAGAWGHDIGELTTQVTVFDGSRLRTVSAAQCKFTYRDSMIKRQGHIILTSQLQFRKGLTAEIQAAMHEYMVQRDARHPVEPSAGSVFKNIITRQIEDEPKVQRALGVTAEEYRDLTPYGKLAVGVIIDRLDLRGKKIGGAQISPRHGNIIVNTGGATASDVLALISLAKQQVRDRLGIQLQEEIEFVGFHS